MSDSPTVVNNSLQRLRYFAGQLLTQRDLAAEQAFHLLLQRLIQRASFGTGTVAGLGLASELDTVQVPGSVFLLPGLAMDPDGRELLVEKPVVVAVAPAPLPLSSHAFSPVPGTKSALASAVASRFGASFSAGDLDALVERFAASGLMSTQQRDDYFNLNDISYILSLIERLAPSTPSLPSTLLDWIDGQLVGVSWVGIRYNEQGTDPTPAGVDGSCCAGTTCFSSRAREGVAIFTSDSAFPEVFDPFAQFETCLAGDPTQICECLLQGWEDLVPQAGECAPVGPIVQLGRVFWSKFEQSPLPQVTAIDNCSRQLAPGGPMLRALAGSSTIHATSSLNVFVDDRPALELSPSNTDNETAALLLVRQGGVDMVKRVLQGPVDSAGSGFRTLRVAN